MIEIIEAWKKGLRVQYLVTIGHDDDWTDYYGVIPPDEQSDRLAWRIKPNQHMVDTNEHKTNPHT